MNFNNIFNAMLSLFVLSTIEGWPTYIYNYIDAGEQGPYRNNNEWVIYYFIIFILFGSMFLLNLFIGVVFLNYHMAEKKAKSKILNDH